MTIIYQRTSSLCGTGLSISAVRTYPQTEKSPFTTLASTAITGLLELALTLTVPTISTSVTVSSIRPVTSVATSAVPFAALSLLHSPSLGRRR